MMDEKIDLSELANMDLEKINNAITIIKKCIQINNIGNRVAVSSLLIMNSIAFHNMGIKKEEYLTACGIIWDVFDEVVNDNPA